MADQFHDSVPTATNQVAADLEDIDEIVGFLKACFQNFCSGWSDTAASSLYPDELASTFNVFGGAAAVSGTVTIAELKKMFAL